MTRWIVLLLPALLLSTSEPVLAAGGPASSGGGVWQMLFALLVVLAVMAAAFWFLRQMTRGPLGGSGPLRLVGSVAVGPKERVVLVECNGAWVLVGTAPGRVNSLHAMPAPGPAAGPAHAVSPESALPLPAQAFRRWLDKAMAARSGKAK